MAKAREPRRDSLAWLDWRCPTEDAARELVESLVWPDGPHCPHCGSADAWRFREKGRKSRPGLYECQHCSRQFTVTTRTPMHATKRSLKLWLKAIYRILLSSKGVSSVILGKQLGVRQSTAWKVAHAVREMTDDRYGQKSLLGRIVEVDTTYMGAPPRKTKSRDNKLIKHKRGWGTKRSQIAVAASRDGRVAAQVIDDDTAIGRAAKVFSGHETVTHRDHEYADGEVHSNTAENLASVLKRAQFGVFYFLSQRHLQRYIDEIHLPHEPTRNQTAGLSQRRARVARAELLQLRGAIEEPVAESCRTTGPTLPKGWDGVAAADCARIQSCPVGIHDMNLALVAGLSYIVLHHERSNR